MIEGYKLTDHIKKRMETREVEQEQVIAALKDPKKIHGQSHDHNRRKVIGKNGVIVIVDVVDKVLITAFADNSEYQKAKRKKNLTIVKKRYAKANYKELAARKREGRWKGGKYKTRFEKISEMRKKKERGVW